MALYPPAHKALLPENATQPKITPRMVIVHSAGGMSELYRWWQSADSHGLESHFWNGPTGDPYQYMDTNVRADANGEANGYAVSIENASSVAASERFWAPQAARIVDELVWLCHTHDIPPELTKTATGRGIAYHVQFGAPGPWTKAAGKVCPGPARIRQLLDEMIPEVARRMGTPAPPLSPRKWIGFHAGATDATVAKAGGLDHEVTEAQLLLTAVADRWNASTIDPGGVDGAYGPRSQSAVREFKVRIISMQRSAGQTVWPNADANVGPQTIGMLRWWASR